MNLAQGKKMRVLTQSELKENLHYNPETGFFTWIKVSKYGGVKNGDLAGTLSAEGYIVIKIDKTLYKAHRLAWLYMTGEMPTHFIDHINGDRADNRFENLRQATWKENAHNQRKPQKNNKSGFLGVTYCAPLQKFKSTITNNKKLKHLGYFATPEEAHQAYLEAKRKIHDFCTI